MIQMNLVLGRIEMQANRRVDTEGKGRVEWEVRHEYTNRRHQIALVGRRLVSTGAQLCALCSPEVGCCWSEPEGGGGCLHIADFVVVHQRWTSCKAIKLTVFKRILYLKSIYTMAVRGRFQTGSVATVALSWQPLMPNEHWAISSDILGHFIWNWGCNWHRW